MKRFRDHLHDELVGGVGASIPIRPEEKLIDDNLQDEISEDVEHTPTDKSGDETQRNQESSTEDGIEGQPRERHDGSEDNDAS
ncbi:hypothetical protein [Rudaea cellulosilytica]|uniref:hypothetical protein n=1 Tax=Rudaea cellulosilytica TaxID=540746 RepID=UPI0012FB97B8|nr:hypothetical protein [Rudaea cellulosilytica]